MDGQDIVDMIESAADRPVWVGVKYSARDLRAAPEHPLRLWYSNKREDVEVEWSEEIRPT